MSVQRITVRIDRITIAGGRHDRRTLAAAIERELGRLLAVPGAVDALGPGRWSGRLDGGRVRPNGDGERALGNAVARATYGVLSR